MGSPAPREPLPRARIARARALALALAAGALAAACNLIVGIDDLPGPEDASADATTDGTLPTDTGTTMTLPDAARDTLADTSLDTARKQDVVTPVDSEPIREAQADSQPVDAGCPLGAPGVVISGSVSGLTAGNTVALELVDTQGGDQTIAASEGSFAFCPIPGGALYTVTVKSPPSPAPELCALTGGAGQASASAAAPPVAVACDEAVAVAVSSEFACALLEGGAVMCWGDNSESELDSAYPPVSATPVIIPSLSGIVSIAVGMWHACALDGAGSVYCWGLASSGQIGNGVTSSAVSPVVQVGLQNATAIAAGGDHTCAVVAGGGVMCWGDNQEQDLGNPAFAANTPSFVPVAVSAPAAPDAGPLDGGADGGLLAGVTSLVLGAEHACALLGPPSAGAREVVCWGSNLFGQLAQPSGVPFSAVPVVVSSFADVVGLGAGADHTCVLQGPKSQCWGSNTSGQLGDGLAGPNGLPTLVSTSSSFSALAGGANFTCAVLAGGGGVDCWGINANGSLAQPSQVAMQTTPVPVVGLPQAGLTAVAAGGDTACVVASGGVDCWGANNVGQAGTRAGFQADTPVATAVTGAVDVASGQDFSCALLGDGGIDCWGTNQSGEIGAQMPVDTFVTQPTPVLLPGAASALAVGRSHVCAVLDGGVACWGDNNDGQLGIGNLTSQTTPVAVAGLLGVTALTAGTDHTCALIDGGAVECWGLDSNDELGNEPEGGAGPLAETPVSVVGLDGPAALIAAGGTHTCALLQSGSVQCWGSDGAGELGIGPGVQAAPTAVAGLPSQATDVSASYQNTCALLTAGALDCWGNNAFWQLGGPSPAQSSNTPLPLDAGLVPVSVSAGQYFACAASTSGAVSCWGAGGLGQLGNGAELAMASPAIVVGLPQATKVAAGWDHTCAVVAGGGVYCWGFAAQGQLGNAVSSSRVVPGPVP